MKTETRLEDLSAELDAVMDQLSELPETSTERDELELRAAKLQWEIDQLGKKNTSNQKEEKEPTAVSPSWKGFAWGAGAVIAIAVLAVALRQNSKPRASVAPPQAPAALEQPQMQFDEASLQSALQANPDSLEAWVHLAILYVQEGQQANAVTAYNEAVQRHPQAAAQLQPLLSEIRAITSAVISGTLQIDRSVKFASGSAIYVIARDPQAGGPPIAVARLTAGSFPMPFALTSHNSMTGGALPQVVRLEARIDADGDAMTKAPGEPFGSVDGIALGATDVRIVLR